MLRFVARHPSLLLLALFLLDLVNAVPVNPSGKYVVYGAGPHHGGPNSRPPVYGGATMDPTPPFFSAGILTLLLSIFCAIECVGADNSNSTLEKVIEGCSLSDWGASHPHAMLDVARTKRVGDATSEPQKVDCVSA